jgi:periplasmic divalent cation tolerance protein
MSEQSGYLLVLTACQGSITAKKIANSLVEGGHAACVNMLPKVTSVFRWKGRIEQAEEYILLIKTTSDRYASVEAAIKAQHPYELPEIIAVPISKGYTKYLSWIDEIRSAANR